MVSVQGGQGDTTEFRMLESDSFLPWYPSACGSLINSWSDLILAEALAVIPHLIFRRIQILRSPYTSM